VGQVKNMHTLQVEKLYNFNMNVMLMTLAARLFLNPLMPELNPFAQCCLTRFLTVDFAS
jgi:hypothetical protein